MSSRKRFQVRISVENILCFLAFSSMTNTLHPNIKFKWKYSFVSIEFLDTRLTLTDGKISTDVYTKPTDNNTFLDYTSCHPDSQKNFIPYTQALRLKRIVSDDATLKSRLDQLEEKCVRSGFPRNTAKRYISKSNQTSRKQLLQKENKAIDTHLVPLICSFHPTVKHVDRIIRKHQHLLQGTELKIRTFWKPPRKIKDQDVSSKLKNSDSDNIPRINTAGTSSACNGSTCLTCQHIKPSGMFSSARTKIRYKIKGENMNCGSSDIVYLIECKRCPSFQYVGETEKKLRVRVNGHRYDIRHNRDTPVGVHFSSQDHSISDLQITPIEKTCGASRRKQREFYWVSQLMTDFPFGSNRDHVLNNHRHCT